MLVVNSLCKNIFSIFFSKFPVFSLYGKMDFQIPRFPCAVATLTVPKSVCTVEPHTRLGAPRDPTVYQSSAQTMTLLGHHSQSVSRVTWYLTLCTVGFSYLNDPSVKADHIGLNAMSSRTYQRATQQTRYCTYSCNKHCKLEINYCLWSDTRSIERSSVTRVKSAHNKACLTRDPDPTSCLFTSQFWWRIWPRRFCSQDI